VVTDPLVLTDSQQLELSRIAQSRSLPAGYVFRARLVLMLAEGASYSTIKRHLRTTAPTMSRWKQRFLVSGVSVWSFHASGQWR
jgi:putative transposase